MNTICNFFAALILAGLTCLPWMAHAQAQGEAIGYVKTVKGDAWITTASQRVKAEPSTPVLLGSQLKTAPGATLGVTFKDNTVMSFGPDTELTVTSTSTRQPRGNSSSVHV